MIVYGDRVKGGKLTILSLYIIGCRNSFQWGAETRTVGCRNYCESRVHKLILRRGV